MMALTKQVAGWVGIVILTPTVLIPLAFLMLAVLGPWIILARALLSTFPG